MIIDLNLFNNTSFGSGKKILCRCDYCYIESLVVKQSILKQTEKTYTICQKCRAAEIGKRNIGIKRSDEHRRKTGLGAKGRIPSAHAIALSTKRFTGKSNPNWNPDRAEVLRKERSRKEAYSLIHNTFKRLKTKKADKIIELLGYSAIELSEHLESLFLPEMGWYNRNKWHIDHIKPVSQFIKEGIVDIKIINVLSNLKPIWAEENLKKYKKWNAL